MNQIMGRVASSFFVMVALLSAIMSAAVAGTPIPTRSVKYLFEFSGGTAGPLAMPSDVAVGTKGRVYVVDGGNHRVVAFDEGGRYLFSFGRQGNGDGELNGPLGIGTDLHGKVYVADSGNNRIQVFNGSGGFLASFPVVDAGVAVKPSDVAVDPAGNVLFITGNSNHKVMAFSLKGTLLRSWGGEGASDFDFRYPATVVVSPEWRVFVVDVLNTRVQVFDGNSNDRGYEVGGWGVVPGRFFRPKGVALDSRGYSFISDSYLDVIQVFDTSYRFQYVLGDNGTPSRFNAPVGIAIDSNDRLYVVEMLANKVSAYALQ